MEIWKEIKNYENYLISNSGNVKSLKNGKERILKTNMSRNYLQVCLSNKNIKNYKKIHQLVAITFLNHNPCGMNLVINHINFNKLDNRVENLEIVTVRDNSNKKHLKSTSKYIGVSWKKTHKSWSSNIFLNGKQKNLGYFKNELEAHNAYQNELKKITS